MQTAEEIASTFTIEFDTEVNAVLIQEAENGHPIAWYRKNRMQEEFLILSSRFLQDRKNWPVENLLEYLNGERDNKLVEDMMQKILKEYF